VVGSLLVLIGCTVKKPEATGIPAPTLTLTLKPSATNVVTGTASPTPTDSIDTPTPPPNLTFTPVLATPTATLQALNKYYDPILGISLSYPNTWKKIGYRKFKGDDGYLTISELPDYHALSADHVCSDYFYQKLKRKMYSFVHFGDRPGCILFQESAQQIKPGDEMLGILQRYNPKTHEYDYFLLTSVNRYFFDIISSLVYDKALPVSDSLLLPSPKPFALDINKLHISETFLKTASFNGEYWDMKNLHGGDGNWDPFIKTTQCGESITVNGHTLDLEKSYPQTGGNLIEVKQDKNVIFSIDVLPSASNDVWAFCEWKGSWFLETSDFIIQNGEILNHKLGYDEMFGWDILAGKQFYFFTKNGIIYISYDGHVLPTKYNYVPHYGCCELGSYHNPHGNDNEVRFFGVRDDKWYFVDITAK
jgi:hypothetical protein